MRRAAFTVGVLLLTLGGFLYQIRLAGALPTMREVMPLAIGLALFAVASVAFAGGRMRFVLSRPWMHYAMAIGLLAALVVFGRRYRGGLYLPGLVNPSEFVKLFVVLFTAGYLARARNEDGRLSFRSICMLVLCLGVLAALVAVVRDFGLLAQIGITVVAMLFASSWGWGLAGATAALAAAVPVAAFPSGHLAVRMAVWRDPFSDATGAGWQTLQGLAALVSGGWLGKGMGMGEVHAVPIVSSDFIYVALAEELGFTGCALMLALWTAVLLLALWPATTAADAPPSMEAEAEELLSAGLVASLACQLVLNVGGVLNALPMTGITLPLLSHGGSSLIAVLIACGLLNANGGRRGARDR